jgi:hypothetical protein
LVNVSSWREEVEGNELRPVCGITIARAICMSAAQGVAADLSLGNE